MTYDGPIIDAHHHFWDLSLGKHLWLAGGRADDDLQPLRRDCLPDEYVRLAKPANVVASVHVEANWDPSDPLGETRWLDKLDRPPGIAERYVAFAPLLEPRAAAIIEAQAAFERVVGIRDILSWHPEPAKRRIPDNDRFTDATWRQNLGRFAPLDLSFDLLISPWQLEDVRWLAEDFPGVQFILNHCGSPMDRDAPGMARWRDGLTLAAEAPNVSIKISDPVAYDPDWTAQSLADVILTIIDIFGAQRCMFATDYPVAGLHIGFAEWIDVFRNAVQSMSATNQRAIFHDNARRYYRFDRPGKTAKQAAAPAE